MNLVYLRLENFLSFTHTCNQVPLVVVERGADGERAVPLRSGGKLGDIAPTLLDLWGLAKPGVMSGESLVEGVRG